MNDRVAIAEIGAVLTGKLFWPTVVRWNRLEGRPRRNDFRRALRAEVRDPLWMLCKQWQVGEFQGDDAASPVSAVAHIETSRIDRYQPGDGTPKAFTTETPIETVVEQRAIPMFSQQQKMSLDIRLLMGRQWRKLLFANSLGHLFSAYVTDPRYRFDDPLPDANDDATLTAHPGVWQTLSAVAGRAMDGGELYLYLRADPGNRAHTDITTDGGEMDTLDTLADRFLAWFDGLFVQPGEGNDAWQDSQLEYRFAVSATKDDNEKVLSAREYYHGHLDWYSLDVDPAHDSLSVEGEEGVGDGIELWTRAFLPTNIEFEGMPNTRWWQFEDSKTSFGDIRPDTTDLSKLLLMEFGLIYANDWFLLPFELPVGTLADVRGLAVTDVFGERVWIEASGKGVDDAWQRWAMYNLSTHGQEEVPADRSLVMLPAVPKIQEGQPFDDVRLVRDEVSNMVWAVEKRVPLSTGRSKVGQEAAAELARRYEQLLDAKIDADALVPSLPEPQASIRYRLMRTVPENWIPFVPVHRENDNREIQLQRASMPRIIQGDPYPPEKIKPRTNLLRSGLDLDPPLSYFLFEEEVPRAGVAVTQSYQRTRWTGGRVFNWIGVHKQTGRGEGHSGLAFDRVEPTRTVLRRALQRFVSDS
jgi:hypothetical protein